VLKSGDDPSVWRFASLGEALTNNQTVLARLIQKGQVSTEQEYMTETAAEQAEVKQR
jgi:hypothetical protein